MAGNTIFRRGQAEEEAGIASEAISPGMLVERGGSDDFQKHSTAGGPAELLIAREQWENEGAGVGTDIASGDEVTVLRPSAADTKLQVLVVSGANIALGDRLTSNGNGLFKEAGTGDHVIARADEAPGALAANALVDAVIGYEGTAA